MRVFREFSVNSRNSRGNSQTIHECFTTMDFELPAILEKIFKNFMNALKHWVLDSFKEVFLEDSRRVSGTILVKLSVKFSAKFQEDFFGKVLTFNPI